MVLHPEETIVALSSAPGPGGRAIVRLSGPEALAVVERVCGSSFAKEHRRFFTPPLFFPGGHSPLLADGFLWPPPKKYTRPKMIENHTLGCPPPLGLLVAGGLQAG